MAANLLSNLPPAPGTDKLVQVYNNLYNVPLELDAGTLNTMKGFLSSRGFDENSAESISVIVINQAKKDGYNPMVILDTLKGLDNVEISALVSEILNYNRFKTSFLGYARQFNTSAEVTRNILV